MATSHYYPYRRRQVEQDPSPSPSRELNAEEKAEAIREKAKRLNSSLCLVLHQLGESGKGIAPIMEVGFDAPGGILKKAIIQLKETAKKFNEEQKVEKFEDNIRALQNDWVSGKPVNVEEAHRLVKDLHKAIESKGDEDEVENLNQQLAALPAKIDQEIERLEQYTHKRVSDQASTEAYKKLVEAAGDQWIKELPYPSDDPGEVKIREEEEAKLGREAACENAIARLVKRNDENIAFNYVDSLACSISREKDKTGRIVFKVQYVNDNPKNVEQAMEKMILRCHELNPTSEIILSCTLLKDIYGDPKKYMEMRLKELKGVVKAAEKARDEGKYIGIVLDHSIKELLAQMPENPGLMSRISTLHQEWAANVQTKNEKIKQEVVERYHREESELWKLLADAPEGNDLPQNTSPEQLTNEVKKLENKYRHLNSLSESVSKNVNNLIKKIEQCKENKNGLETCLEELKHLEIVQGKLSKESENCHKSAENFASWFAEDKIKKILPVSQPEEHSVTDEVEKITRCIRSLNDDQNDHRRRIQHLIKVAQKHKEAAQQKQLGPA
ncbi:MAG: hypothetical protein K0R24_502 [Gammaproteobacteria bacterium]|jgi:hypothetical protein|nr:hypothetical protein [Gammaproteobacteria bacterium]